MKKLTTIVMAMMVITMTSFAQSDSTKKSTGCHLSKYVSVGISVTNSNDFKTSSYTGIEFGVMKDNLCLGAVFGRGSLAGLGAGNDNIQNYFYEIKPSACFPIGILTGNVLFGWGGYIDTPNHFIEYGVGIAYCKGKMGYGVNYSNSAGTNYISPGITFNF